MGICYSRIERQEAVTRCKARRRYMKQLVKERTAFFEAHTSYLRSLRRAGTALHQFSNVVADLQLQHHLPPCPSSPPSSISPSSDLATSASNSSQGSATTAEESGISVDSASKDAAESTPCSMNEHPNDAASEITKEIPPNSKDISEVMKELDEYFIKAADGGNRVSVLLADPCSAFPNQRTKNKVHNCSMSFSPMLHSCSSDSETGDLDGILRMSEEIMAGDGKGLTKESHRATIERLYSMEKKLHQEAKIAENIKQCHEKRLALLKKQEANKAEQGIIETTKREIEKLESKLMVASQAMEATSEEIIRLREDELYPQLLELIKGLIGMWKSMYESHQAQSNLVQELQLNLENSKLMTEPTSKAHFKTSIKLELEIQQWHSAFCNLIKTHRDYMCSLTGWLRLSLFQLNHPKPNKTQQSPSSIYSLSEEWQLALDRVPYNAASEGIKSFLTVVHTFILQQDEVQKQKRRMEAEAKEIERRMVAIQSLESKFNQQSNEKPGCAKLRKTIAEKRVEVETMRAKAKEEKTKHEKFVSMMKETTLNSLKIELPHMFKSMMSFSSLYMEEFKSVHNKINSFD